MLTPELFSRMKKQMHAFCLRRQTWTRVCLYVNPYICDMWYKWLTLAMIRMCTCLLFIVLTHITIALWSTASLLDFRSRLVYSLTAAAYKNTVTRFLSLSTTLTSTSHNSHSESLPSIVNVHNASDNLYMHCVHWKCGQVSLNVSYEILKWGLPKVEESS